jgi:tetratricopeptide (TPR) repeat protein
VETDAQTKSAALRGLAALVATALVALAPNTALARQAVPKNPPPTAPSPNGPPPTTAPPPAAKQPGGRLVGSDSYPDDPRIDIARRLLGSNQLSEALMVLKGVLDKRPDIGRAQFYMGVTLTKMKQYQQARPHFEQAIKSEQLFPERKHAHHFMGWASYHLGELDRSKAEFMEHLALVPDEPDSIFALGVIAFDSDDLDEAEARFKRAIELQQGPKADKRDVAKAWARLGDVSMRRDQGEAAEELYMKSLALYPDHYEVWAKLARVRDRIGKAREAESAREEEKHARERVTKRGADTDDSGPPPLLADPKPADPASPATKPAAPPNPTKP